MLATDGGGMEIAWRLRTVRMGGGVSHAMCDAGCADMTDAQARADLIAVRSKRTMEPRHGTLCAHAA